MHGRGVLLRATSNSGVRFWIYLLLLVAWNRPIDSLVFYVMRRTVLGIITSATKLTASTLTVMFFSFFCRSSP
jgi:hypothetical protein